jgi:hypothetical protein
MKTFSVSLDVTSTKLSLHEIAARIGMEPSPDSHDKGSPRGRGSTWSATIWRLSSQPPESAPLKVHLEDLLSKFHEGVLTSACAILDAQVDLSIGVFFDEAYCSVSIPTGFLDAIKEYPVGLEITCYPSQMEGED